MDCFMDYQIMKLLIKITESAKRCGKAINVF